MARDRSFTAAWWTNCRHEIDFCWVKKVAVICKRKTFASKVKLGHPQIQWVSHHRVKYSVWVLFSPSGGLKRTAAFIKLENVLLRDFLISRKLQFVDFQGSENDVTFT